MNMQEIGRRISTLRKERDMTQLELADKIGVSYQAVSSWERGLTMPDISKLPDISQVLATPIDVLLGNGKHAEMVTNILNNRTEVYEENPIEMDVLLELAPIVKPGQMNELAGSVKSWSIKELSKLAPFVDSETLYKMAIKCESDNDIKGLSHIAPFLEREHMDELAMKVGCEADGIKSLSHIAPFVSKTVLGELAKNAVNEGTIKELSHIAPFLSKEDLNALAIKIESVENIGALTHIAPFIGKDVLGELAIKAVSAGNINELTHIAPFLEKGLLSKLVMSALGPNEAPEDPREN